jgi:Flp pilus assembly protein TadG
MLAFHRLPSIGKFLDDRSGNFALIACLVVFMAAVGVAIDVERLDDARDAAQNALDWAVLATLKGVKEGEIGKDHTSPEESWVPWIRNTARI